MGRGQWHSFSTCGLLLGTLFFAVSLTPSLLPRSFLTQGVVSGSSLAAGYGIGVFWGWLWAYMELPQPKRRLLRVAMLAASTSCAVLAVISMAGGRMAEFDPGADGTQFYGHGISTLGRLACTGGFCNPDDARTVLPPDAPLRGGKS
jgi:Alpha/beta-hydrolase family N-terminus